MKRWNIQWQFLLRSVASNFWRPSRLDTGVRTVRMMMAMEEHLELWLIWSLMGWALRRPQELVFLWMSRESSTGQCCSSTLNTARQTSYLPSARTPGLLQTQKDIQFVSLLRKGGLDREIIYSLNIFDFCVSASSTIWQLCLVKSFLLGIQIENISRKI